MRRIAQTVFVAGMAAYVVALLLMDEIASDLGNGAMLTAALLMLFRIDSRLARESARSPELNDR